MATPQRRAHALTSLAATPRLARPLGPRPSYVQTGVKTGPAARIRLRAGSAIECVVADRRRRGPRARRQRVCLDAPGAGGGPRRAIEPRDRHGRRARSRAGAGADGGAAGAIDGVGTERRRSQARRASGQRPLAPSAHGRAFWSRSRGGLVFTATNLPAPPDGKVYQLWFVTTVAVSAGLLQPDESGQVSMVAPTDRSMGEPVAMAVTLEPAGGVPHPLGRSIWSGSRPQASDGLRASGFGLQDLHSEH